MNKKLLWWQKGIIYQIYPRSYQDSNNDGIGDLPGICQRLDHLQSLNIDAIWLSPIYPSPMHDFGYDVADYIDIHPLFGTMADFDNLLAEIHARGLKLIIDLVPNHTSDEHAWFQESRSSRDNPKRDWYIWRDPAPDGGPPNNWLSFFGGPAWTFDKTTGQYYLHQFVTQQPELNYRHPDVLPAMLDVMRFWLDKGVDGFRVDVIWLMIKDEQFRDEPPNPQWDGANPFNSLQHIYTQNLPEVHELIRKMRAVLDEYDERMMVGEIYLPFDQLATYYGTNFDECHLPFNFHLIYGGNWQAQAIRQMVDVYEATLPRGAWPNWVLGNHDQHRIASRVGVAQARVANMLLLTLRGTPTTYYGEEIGMVNGHIPPELVQDPPAVNQPELADKIGRDPVRTPMQWDDSVHAGFSGETAVPWLPVAENYQTVNVAAQNNDPTSMLNFYRALTQLRGTEPALYAGSYRAVDANNEDVFAYVREADGRSFLIVLNFTGDAQEVNITELEATATIILATDMQRSGSITLPNFTLAANQGLILQL
ncbi:alpha-amylase family glycosyl hydrolase [Candidatus Leptofilum sp.]|uniref:alpha-amylase family glycosyl hydrolase n=1 Tax=Candidatus Leptofilum sp. TaxID=3241576 RepID=UPI003B5AE95D